ncbi:MAG: heparan-alpha-glucosaminide N-acetyltransferase domain-containing protein [Kofleriaceae bacterium]
MAQRARVEAIDIMRGLILVIMALDHVREFWSNAAVDPTDASKTTVALFATRWITHLCAPWFMLLSGASAAISLERRGHRGLSEFLLTRGLWLIFLELTIVNFIWKGPRYDPQFLRQMVLCALGGSMIVLAGLSWLPRWAILAFAVAMICGHDLFDQVEAKDLSHFAWLWQILHDGGGIGAEPGQGWSYYILYPLVPWIGVMALGYVAVPWIFARERPARTLVIIGSALLVAFVVIRGHNVYGDYVPRETFGDPVRDAMSFLAVSKYPPTLDYLLVTIGVGALVLALIHVLQRGRWLATFGRVPMFYYLAHLTLITMTFFAVHRIATGTWAQDYEHRWGFDLAIVYALWVAHIIVLFPLCRWFSGVKARRDDWWLSYL